MEILMFGGTGLVGSKVIDLLMEEDSVQQITTIHRHSCRTNCDKLKEIVIVNQNPESIGKLKIKADVVICTLGTTIKKAGTSEKFRAVDYDLVLTTARYAEKIGAKFIVVSAAGADSSSAIFYNRVKGELEDSVQNLELKSWIIFRPSLLIGKRRELRLAESLGIKTFQMVRLILPSKLRRLAGTKVKVLAQHIVEEALSKKLEKKVIGPTEIIAPQL